MIILRKDLKCVLAPKDFHIIWFSNILALSVPEEGYYRNMSCTLTLVSMFLLLSLGRYLCWWTISTRGNHMSSSQCYDTNKVY